MWTKTEGCDGETTWGSRPAADGGKSGATSEFCSFAFDFMGGALRIVRGDRKKRRAKRLRATAPGKGQAVGCGKSIRWSEMAPVTVPAEFNVTAEVITQ